MNITIRTSCQRQQGLSLSCKSTYHFYNTEFSFPKILLLTSKCCKFSFLNKLTTSKTKATQHLFIFHRNCMSSECKAQAQETNFMLIKTTSVAINSPITNGFVVLFMNRINTRYFPSPIFSLVKGKYIECTTTYKRLNCFVKSDIFPIPNTD